MTEDSYAETGLIGGVLVLGNDPIPPAVLTVEPEYFATPKHAAIWAAILELLAERAAVDEITVAKRCAAKGERVAAYLHQLADEAPTSANVGVWARLIAAEGEAKALAAEMRRVLAEGGPPEVLSARMAEVARRAKSSEDRRGLIHVREALGSLLRELEAEHLNRDANRAAKTGIADLDKAVEMRPGHLTVIAGRPGMGKSALAGNVAQYCAMDPERGATALFSLEMDACSLVKRMVAAQVGVDTKSLAAMAGSESGSGKLVGAMEKMHKLSLYIDDRPGLSVAEMRQELMRLGRVRLVIVDYLQLSKMDAKLERQDLRVGAVTKGLKAMAKDFDCHVIALSQLNRAVESRSPPVPHMSDLRDSGNIEEDAENVWLLYRPGYYKKDADDTDAEIIVGKARHGRSGVVNCKWNAARQQFYSLTQEGRQ
jgi:replicative DNA helicase